MPIIYNHLCTHCQFHLKTITHATVHCTPPQNNPSLFRQVSHLWEYLKQFEFLLQDVDASEIKVQVCVYAFDLLYLNGEVSSSAHARKNIIKIFPHSCHFKSPCMFIEREREKKLGCQHHLNAIEGAVKAAQK